MIDLGNGASTGGFELSPDGTMLAAVVDAGRTTELQIIDLTTLKPRAAAGDAEGHRLAAAAGARARGKSDFTLGSVKAQGDVVLDRRLARRR